MATCELIVALAGILVPITDAVSQKTLLAFICLWIATFAVTWGPSKPNKLASSCHSFVSVWTWLTSRHHSDLGIDQRDLPACNQGKISLSLRRCELARQCKSIL